MPLPRRFDQALMRAPAAGGVVDTALLSTLRTWCEGGAWPTRVELLRVASIAPCAGLDAAACVLDGSHRLARLGRWRGLGWRLHIVWREYRAPPGEPPDVPWDCGWWRDGALGPAEVFRPRRATLLMLRDPAPAVATDLLARLRAQSPAYSHPLRVLLVSAAPPAAVTRL